MRNLASALAVKSRAGKSEDNASSLSRAPSYPTASPVRGAKARSHTLFSKAPKTPVDTTASLTPPSRPALTPGSSASSDGSASLRTPDDDGMMAFPKPEQEKKKWSGWFGRRKSSLKAVADSDGMVNAAIPPVQNHNPPRPLHDRPPVINSDDDSDNDDDDDCSDEYGVADIAMAPSSRIVLSPATYAKAQANLRVILRNKLVSTHDAPPLVDKSSPPFFPRSAAVRMPFHHTLQSAMHTRKMLRRIERKSLTRNEHASIAAFGARPKPNDLRGGVNEG